MSQILVIDDEQQVRSMLKEILEDEGYDVFEAEDGDKGLRLCEDQSFDLVITDLIMPNKEGIETIRELRKNFPEIKVIAISGGGRVVPTTYLGHAQQFGAVRTFQKPIEFTELLDAIEEILH